MSVPERSPSATVVGGGPAGLIAAEVLATAGFAVEVFEHMASVGRKFLLAGRGGLNLTHNEPFETFAARYGPAREQLEPALMAFDPHALRTWCEGLGEETFVGSSGRVFPSSFRATPLLRAWLNRLDDLGVVIHTRHRWSGFDLDGTPAGSTFTISGSPATVPSGTAPSETAASETAPAMRARRADVTVMALGGASWPRVGSDGGWTGAFGRAGVDVSPLRAANCAIQVPWTPVFVDRFAGHPLKNVAVTAGGRTVRGDCMVTTTGLEGGPIYAHSAAIRDALDAGSASVQVDLTPDLTTSQLTTRLETRRAKESTSSWLRRSGFSAINISLMREATGNTLPATAIDMATLARAVPITVDSAAPIARAISSAGGVGFDQIDERFMLWGLPGVFVAGEMLDWEAPTGGYLLQGCFSTGVAAARGAIAFIDEHVERPSRREGRDIH